MEKAKEQGKDFTAKLADQPEIIQYLRNLKILDQNQLIPRASEEKDVFQSWINRSEEVITKATLYKEFNENQQ